MAQDAFLRAFRALSSWRKEAVFSTWLFALAANLYRSEIRRIPVGSRPLDDLIEAADLHDGHVELENKHRERFLHAAVDAMPSKYREVLILFYFHDMDVATAACSLGVPEGTFKARLFRARKVLRSKLEGKTG
jgi:RNA polymerase sigma-70 factor (ECF subfamily)